MELAWTAEGSPESGDGRPSAPPGRMTRLASVWDEYGPEELAAEATEATMAADRTAAMRDLYERRHADMVRFAAFLTGDAVSAEDVAHDAFAKVFDAWDRIEHEDRLDAYLKATVVNLVRGGHRRHEVADRARQPHLSVVRSAEDDVIDELRRRRTLEAVASLPLRQRACVVMRHWMRMTETEIAATLEISVGSVRTHVKRGMRALEKNLGASS